MKIATQRSLIIIFVLLRLFANGQVTIKEIKRQPDTRLFNTSEFTISYPVVVTNSKAVDEKINFQIRSELIGFDSAFWDKPLDAALDSFISDALVYMSYQVTFNSNNILSFTVTAESCAAYCSGWQRNFNFNTRTGDAITVDDIFKTDAKNTFTDSVFRRKVNELVKFKSELKERFDRKEVDADTYASALESIELYCIKSVSLNQFSLSDSELVIFDDCEFPHVMQDMQPVYKLNYSYESIKGSLNRKWKKILTK